MSFANKDYSRFAVQIPEDLKTMIPVFLKRRKDDLNLLTTAMHKKDFVQIAKIGHQMKGVGTSYGFPAFTEMGKDIEMAGKAQKIDEVKQICEKFGKYLNSKSCQV